jgi:hypothetical protein
VILANLVLLLMGFALLSRHFEESKLPDVMPAFLPDDWKGAFALLAIVCVISSMPPALLVDHRVGDISTVHIPTMSRSGFAWECLS